MPSSNGTGSCSQQMSFTVREGVAYDGPKPIQGGSILKLRTAYSAGLSMVHFSKASWPPAPYVRST
jgi:hypothetical protein